MFAALPLFLAVLLALPAPRPGRLHAQEYQLRLLTHGQWAPTGGPLGLAGWAVLPNVMHEQDPGRTLLLGGVLLRSERRWIEFLGGSLFSGQQDRTTVLQVRFLERRPWASLFLEGEHVPSTRRTVVLSNAVLRFRIGTLRLGAGLEGEWIHAQAGNTGIVGPRLSVALPGCARVCRDAAITTAFRMHSDGHRTVRQYVAVNF